MNEWERCRHWLDLALDGTHSIEDAAGQGVVQ